MFLLLVIKINLTPSSARTPETKEILDGWNLEFDDTLLRYQGRVLPTETIYQQSTSVSCREWIEDHLALVESPRGHVGFLRTH